MEQTEEKKPVIAIVAANGKSGQVMVRTALSLGYQVRAGIHSYNPFSAHPGLTVVQGDATHPQDMRELLTGSDVVISLIGHGRHSPRDVQTRAIQVLLAVMTELNLSTLFSLTGTGARLEGDRPSLFDRVANWAIEKIDPARIADGKNHMRLLMESNVNWTVVRVLKLTNGAHHGKVVFSSGGPAEPFTPRTRVAAAIVQLIEEGDYIKQAPVISGYKN